MKVRHSGPRPRRHSPLESMDLGNNNEEPLAFIWPNKSGPQFPIDSTAPAFVRPYPTSVTECVDDKLLLAKTLRPYDVMPECLDNIEDTMNDVLYFVKHRHGAQGKSVYVHDKASLLSWSQSCKNSRDFVIQRQVIPALDELGRKFVLRGHVLLYKRGNTGALHAGLHRNVICLPHALPYESRASAPKSVHTSQAGKRHPPPSLLSELNSSHPAASLFPAILSCTRIFLMANLSSLDQPVANGITCFALLGADYLVSCEVEVKLCEVNSHPALGWGSMSNVPRQVFARLVEEMLDVVVFEEQLSATGFVPISLED